MLNPLYFRLALQPVPIQDVAAQPLPPKENSAVQQRQTFQQSVNPTDYIDADIDIPADSHSFMPLPHHQLHEVDLIRVLVNGEDPLHWPTIAGQPINEFQTPGLATMEFPTLFPYGKDDPTTKDRQCEVPLAYSFKHLMRYGDTTPAGLPRSCFTFHPRFPYRALNMKQRHQLLSQSKIYFQRTPADANLTVDQLRDMVGHMNSDPLIKCIQRYAAKVQGTNQYWFQRLHELRALFDQKGMPTFFGPSVLQTTTGQNYTPLYHILKEVQFHTAYVLLRSSTIHTLWIGS